MFLAQHGHRCKGHTVNTPHLGHGKLGRDVPGIVLGGFFVPGRLLTEAGLLAIELSLLCLQG